MKYLCLVYLEHDKLHAVPDSECQTCGDGLRKSGLLVAAEALERAGAAELRFRLCQGLVGDGDPFDEGVQLRVAEDLPPRAARDLVARLGLFPVLRCLFINIGNNSSGALVVGADGAAGK